MLPTLSPLCPMVSYMNIAHWALIGSPSSVRPIGSSGIAYIPAHARVRAQGWESNSLVDSRVYGAVRGLIRDHLTAQGCREHGRGFTNRLVLVFMRHFCPNEQLQNLEMRSRSSLV